MVYKSSESWPGTGILPIKVSTVESSSTTSSLGKIIQYWCSWGIPPDGDVVILFSRKYL